MSSSSENLKTALHETSTLKIPQLFPDIPYIKLPTVQEHPNFHYKGFLPSQTVLPKGHIRGTGLKSFPIDIMFERDIEVHLRDGIKVYADLFRPVDSDDSPVPVIIPWSPYGKTGSGPQQYDDIVPFRAGYAKDKWSGYQKFEAPDPAEWCVRDYAVLNVDPRGVANSEGDIPVLGRQDAEDIFDVIDYVYKQPWCNGSVAMAYITQPWLNKMRLR